MIARIDNDYVQALIAGGVDPQKAREIARKTAADQSASTGQTPDLFAPAAEPKPSISTPRESIAPTLLDAAATIGTEPPSGSDIAYLG